MKNRLVLLLLLLVSCSQAVVWFGSVPVYVEVASSPDEWARGLQHREVLAERAGMLFVFPEERRVAFWMVNMSFPLDMVFLDGERRVVAIDARVLPCVAEPCAHYVHDNVQFVVEVNAGFIEKYAVVVGDQLVFS